MDILKIFGARIKEVRLEKGLSQEKLSFGSDLHRTYIGGVERGEINISLLNIKKLADGLELSLEELFKL
jgi:transcriptional regulator with XRE-family HTH domain